ncbi:MAG: MBL fold metallo-hydrolase [Clostridiales bacterium]|nr:MBL fold metallo-hydrolase [Clostridiales bacterium]
MRVVCLVENTPGKESCAPAHGLSLYVETARHRLLMDTGPSDLLIGNAQAAGVDLKTVDTAVISHGHYDHAGGLPAFAALNPSAAVYLRAGADGDFYSGREADGSIHYIGVPPTVRALPRAVWVRENVLEIDGELTLFGGVSGRKYWPQANRLLSRRVDGRFVQDDFSHEQCLLVREGKKTALFSGCAHNGVLNILDRCLEITGKAPDAVVSGFHMMKKTGEYTPEEWAVIDDTARQLQKWPTVFYTCHCTGLPAYERMRMILGDQVKYLSCGAEITLL